jgi:hypothetical protein
MIGKNVPYYLTTQQLSTNRAMVGENKEHQTYAVQPNT